MHVESHDIAKCYTDSVRTANTAPIGETRISFFLHGRIRIYGNTS